VKARREIKEFEAIPNPWKGNQQTKTVQFDPKEGPKGKAVIKKDKKSKKEKPKIAEPEKPKAEKKPSFTDEQFLEALRKIGKPATSREVSDALEIADSEVGRQLVRSRMKKLAEEGKVKVTEAEKGRARLYNVA
jgi:hypothetical protein